MDKTGPSSPIFIVGAPRSGTSILNWALGQHPNIQVMPETAWIAMFTVNAMAAHRVGSERGPYSHLSNVAYPVGSFLQHVAQSIDGIVHEVYEERCCRLYGDYRKNGIQLKPESPRVNFQVRRSPDDPKKRWIDGTPLNSHFIWPLAQAFPHARFIHNLRHPADVAISLENFEKVGAVSQSLKKGLATWIRHTSAVRLAEQALGPERFFRLDFERIEKEPERLVADVLNFVGEEFHPDCLLPLSERINSSTVEDRRRQSRERVEKLRAFRKAERLFHQLEGTVVSDVDREMAVRTLSDRLERYLSQKRLRLRPLGGTAFSRAIQQLSEKLGGLM